MFRHITTWWIMGCDYKSYRMLGCVWSAEHAVTRWTMVITLCVVTVEFEMWDVVCCDLLNLRCEMWCNDCYDFEIYLTWNIWKSNGQNYGLTSRCEWPFCPPCKVKYILQNGVSTIASKALSGWTRQNHDSNLIDIW